MPIIAGAVAVLPFVARRFGEGDIAAIRRGMRDIIAAATVYCVGLVTPAMLLCGRRLAHALAESPQTADLGTVALAFCPLACLAMIPFALCRPAFEGLQRGRPGLTMAAVRYVLLTIPCALAGMQAAGLSGQPVLYGLIGGLIVSSSIASIIFLAWLRRALRRLEDDTTGPDRSVPLPFAAAPGDPGRSAQPVRERFASGVPGNPGPGPSR